LVVGLGGEKPLRVFRILIKGMKFIP